MILNRKRSEVKYKLLGEAEKGVLGVLTSCLPNKSQSLAPNAANIGRAGGVYCAEGALLSCRPLNFGTLAPKNTEDRSDEVSGRAREALVGEEKEFMAIREENDVNDSCVEQRPHRHENQTNKV